MSKTTEYQNLRKCPFCESECNEANIYHGYNNLTWFVSCNKCGAKTALCDSEESAIAAWNHRTSGWISVEDRLPEEDVMVLVYGEKNGTGGIYIDEIYRGNFDYAVCNDVTITHWQPLPDPPEMVQDV